MAARLAEGPEIEILNDVHLNQVLFRVRGADGDGRTRTLAQRVRDGRVCWLSGTSWEDRPAVRVSVTSWRTTAADADRSAASILAAVQSQPPREKASAPAGMSRHARFRGRRTRLNGRESCAWSSIRNHT
jgi:glutamate/tyrosine decarboxylase-like PLP-dependent enzyme